MQRKLQYKEKQRRYAWAQFYKARREEHEAMQALVELYNTKTREMPDHIKNELKELYIEMKKKIECPICLHEIESDDLDWTKCGHKYCKACLKRLKETSNKCAICRRELK